MEPGLHGPERDTDAIRHLGQRKVEVVMEDEHGPVLEGEPLEGTLELVAVVDGVKTVGVAYAIPRQDPDLG